jgi:hypothetical protein
MDYIYQIHLKPKLFIEIFNEISFTTRYIPKDPIIAIGSFEIGSAVAGKLQRIEANKHYMYGSQIILD